MTECKQEHCRFFRRRAFNQGLRFILLSLVALFIAPSAYAAPGDLDPTFDGDGKVGMVVGVVGKPLPIAAVKSGRWCARTAPTWMCGP